MKYLSVSENIRFLRFCDDMMRLLVNILYYLTISQNMDDYETARICDALGHPLRVRIYKILLERGNTKASELFHELKDEFDISSRQTIFNHINYLGTSDIVETRKEKGEVIVKLKKKIKIEVEEV